MCLFVALIALTLSVWAFDASIRTFYLLGRGIVTTGLLGLSTAFAFIGFYALLVEIIRHVIRHA